MIRLTRFLWVWFQCVCPLMPSCNTYHFTWVTPTLGMGYLFTAAPAKQSCCSSPWMRGISSRRPSWTSAWDGSSRPFCAWAAIIKAIYFSYFYFLFNFLKFIYLFTLQYCIVFAIHRHESATGVHEFLILNPPSHLPPYIISLGHPSAPAPSTISIFLPLKFQFPFMDHGLPWWLRR